MSPQEFELQTIFSCSLLVFGVSEIFHVAISNSNGLPDIVLTANGAAGWGYIGEISLQRLRPYTAGFDAASTCVVGVIMNVLVPKMTSAADWNWEYKTGWFYAGVGLPFAVGVWFLIPETKG